MKWSRTPSSVLVCKLESLNMAIGVLARIGRNYERGKFRRSFSDVLQEKWGNECSLNSQTKVWVERVTGYAKLSAISCVSVYNFYTER
jgi:hypothetical protein